MRRGPQGLLAGGEELLSPALYLGQGEAVLASRLAHRGLTLDDAQKQGRSTLGRPALHLIRDLRHCCHLPCVHNHHEHVVVVASRFRGAS